MPICTCGGPRCSLCTRHPAHNQAGPVPVRREHPPERHRPVASGQPTMAPEVHESCTYLGRTVPAPSGLDLRRNWRACELPLAPLGPTVCQCQGCGVDCVGHVPESRDARPVGRRHLLYHVYPRRLSVWRWRLAQMLARWQHWDGHHVVTIGTDETTEDAAAVEALLPPGTTVVKARANKELGETHHWREGWETLFSLGVEDDDIVLRGHAKGTTRKLWEYHHEWHDWTLHTLTDYPHLVDAALAGRPIAGSLFLTHSAPWNYSPNCDWHYAGSFYWVRAGEARTRYRHITPNRFGIESWPAEHWPRHQAGRLYRPPGDLPDEQRWVRCVRPWWDWLSRYTAQLSFTLPTLHVVTPVTRESNLPRIQASLDRLGMRVEWHCVSGHGVPWGNAARDAGLAQVTDPEALVVFLDDDNVLHPYLPGTIAAGLVHAPHADAWMVGQRRGNSVMPGKVQCGHIDTAHMVWRRRTLDGIKWDCGVAVADYEIVRAAVRRGANIAHLPTVAALYNWLR